MNRSKKRSASALVLAIAIGCLGFPSAGFSVDRSSEFHAGPLSIVAETIVEAKIQKPVADENSEPIEKEKKEETILKKQEKNIIHKV